MSIFNNLKYINDNFTDCLLNYKLINNVSR